jgi:hypothetical protein
MTYASVRAAAEHIARTGTITPHQLAAFSALWESMTDAQKQQFTELWRAQGSPAAPKGMNLFDRLMPLLDLIAQSEGNYNSVNRGRAGDTPGGYPGLDRLTIGQVRSLQRDEGIFAVGRYQFIPSTLEIAVRDSGMLPSDLFNPEGQDMLAVALLLGGKRPKLRDYLQGGDVSLEDAQLELAKEWASIPMANGKGFYDGDSAGNRASAKVAEVQKALKQARESLAGKTLPQLRLPAQQAVPVRLPNHMTLMRTGQVDPRGLELLKLEFVVNSIPMAHLLVVSGAPGRQKFRRGRDSRAQSMEPLPEGRWGVENIEWASGRDNYNATWGPGLGPVWVGLNYQAPGKTERSAIGIHYDENHGVAPGSAGCVVLRSIADVKRCVELLRKHDPRLLFVNWSLGTCPPVRPI